MIKMLEVNIIKWEVDWQEIKNLCRGTINLGDSNIVPPDDWKKDLLLAEHSPLRHSLITIELKNIPYYVTTHLVRHHIGIEKYISTSREDRTNIPRDSRKQTDTVTMRMDLNIQSLINISRKRLCGQADPITRKVWELVVEEVAKYDENIAFACVPEGIRSAGCPEAFGDCFLCNALLKNMETKDIIDIKKRYLTYNKKIRGVK